MITPWRYHTISSQIASFNILNQDLTLPYQIKNQMYHCMMSWEQVGRLGSTLKLLGKVGDDLLCQATTMSWHWKWSSIRQTLKQLIPLVMHVLHTKWFETLVITISHGTGWVGNELEVSWRWHGSCLKSLTMTKNVEWSLQRLHLATPSGTITRNFRKQPLGCHWSWDLFLK